MLRHVVRNPVEYAGHHFLINLAPLPNDSLDCEVHALMFWGVVLNSAHKQPTVLTLYEYGALDQTVHLHNTYSFYLENLSPLSDL